MYNAFYDCTYIVKCVFVCNLRINNKKEIKMGCTKDSKTEYNGTIESGKSKLDKPKFDWISLVVWVASVVVSMIPIYLLLIPHLEENNGKIQKAFWFSCFKEYDMLWIFATVLLFACVNQVTSLRRKSKLGINNKQKDWQDILVITGFIVFAFVEATWVAFKYVLVEYQTWPIWIGTALILFSVAIATPLQINFISNGE